MGKWLFDHSEPLCYCHSKVSNINTNVLLQIYISSQLLCAYQLSIHLPFFFFFFSLKTTFQIFASVFHFEILLPFKQGGQQNEKR